MRVRIISKKLDNDKKKIIKNQKEEYEIINGVRLRKNRHKGCLYLNQNDIVISNFGDTEYVPGDKFIK